jgi:hypothetical protein
MYIYRRVQLVQKGHKIALPAYLAIFSLKLDKECVICAPLDIYAPLLVKKILKYVQMVFSPPPAPFLVVDVMLVVIVWKVLSIPVNRAPTLLRERAIALDVQVLDFISFFI